MSGFCHMKMALTPEAFARYAGRIAYMPTGVEDKSLYELLADHAKQLGYKEGASAFIDFMGDGLTREQINQLYGDDLGLTNYKKKYWERYQGSEPYARADKALRALGNYEVNDDEELVKIIAAIPPAVSTKMFGRETDEYMYIGMTRSKSESFTDAAGEQRPKTFIRVGGLSYSDSSSELSRIVREEMPAYMESISREVMRDLALARAQHLKSNPELIKKALKDAHDALNAQGVDGHNITGVKNIKVTWSESATEECDFQAIVTVEYIDEPRGQQEPEKPQSIVDMPKRKQEPQQPASRPRPRGGVQLDRI